MSEHDSDVSVTYCVYCSDVSPAYQCVTCAGDPSIANRYCFACSLKHIESYYGHEIKDCSKSKPKKGNKKCEHNKEQRDCKLCRGSRICEHDRSKRTCTICVGMYLSFCSNCLDNFCFPFITFLHVYIGSRICPHGKHKHICKLCGGSAICPHNRIKYSCRQCKSGNPNSIVDFGSPVDDIKADSLSVSSTPRESETKSHGSHKKCEHNREQRNCRDCGGSRICVHDKYKYACRECGFSKKSKSSHSQAMTMSFSNSSAVSHSLSDFATLSSSSSSSNVGGYFNSTTQNFTGISGFNSTCHSSNITFQPMMPLSLSAQQSPFQFASPLPHAPSLSQPQSSLSSRSAPLSLIYTSHQQPQIQQSHSGSSSSNQLPRRRSHSSNNDLLLFNDNMTQEDDMNNRLSF